MSRELLRPLAAGDEDPVLALLRAGIPLSLLLDLAAGDPSSEEIYASEQAAASEAAQALLVNDGGDLLIQDRAFEVPSSQ